MARDYILRLIEQMAALFAGVIAKEKAGQLVEAKRDLDALCVQTIGMEVAALKAASPEAVAERLKDTGGLRHVRAVTLAELLLREAGMNRSEESPQPAGSAEVHAFCLLADSWEAFGQEDQEHYRVKLEQLADGLGPFRGHPYVLQRLESLGLREGG